MPSGVRKPLMQEPAVGMVWAMGFCILGLPRSERLEERLLAPSVRRRCLRAGPQSFLRRSGVRLSDWERSPFGMAQAISLAAAGLKRPYGEQAMRGHGAFSRFVATVFGGPRG